MAEQRRRAPSARYIAAKGLLYHIAAAKKEGGETILPRLSNLSRLTEKKLGDSRKHMAKLSGRFEERLKKIIDRFDNPPPKDPNKKKAGRPFQKKKAAAE
jgi:hypothetical protein